MSASSSACGSVSHGATSAPTSIGQFLRVRERAADDDHRRDALRLEVRAVSFPISPAPTTSTRRPERLPKIFRARLTAAKLTETAPSASAVSDRTRLPTPNAQWNSRLRSGPGAVGGRRDAVGVLDLPENLRLADHQRVEPRRDTEKDAGRRRRSRCEYRCGPISSGDRRWNSAKKPLSSAAVARGSSQATYSSARLQVETTTASAAARLRDQRPHRVLEAAAAEVEPFAELDGRRAVTCADQHQMHVRPRSCGCRSGSN